MLVAGEDRTELLKAIAGTSGQRPLRHHEFRCYEFWRYPEFTVGLCGIGTGCLEPLLHEILSAPSPVHTIILAGTAGVLQSSTEIEIGETYAIVQARTNLTAIDRLLTRPARPVWDRDLPCAKAMSLSTELYYAAIPSEELQRLSEAERKRLLIEMEVAQFYYLCSTKANGRQLRYIAVKNASNHVGDLNQHLSTSALSLAAAVAVAVRVMHQVSGTLT
jgi:hypothetical protein